MKNKTNLLRKGCSEIKNFKNFKKIEVNPKPRSKKGQLAVFVIIAIVIIAGIGIYFLVKGRIIRPSLPPQFEPVYDHYISCIENDLKSGAIIIGERGGYIEVPDFEPGSSYAPFSSQLDFLGNPVPYWYYVSGNGIIKQQVPSERDMQEQLEDFVDLESVECDFGIFEQQGYVIDIGEAETRINIQDNKISANIKSRLNITYQEASVILNSHTAEVSSRLGRNYELAKKIYDHELESMFLENYGVDIMYLYAPVSGVEISCEPKIWNPSEVVDDIKENLEVNIQQLKVKGNYYDLSEEAHKYFVVDVGEEVSDQVNFLYLEDWPTRVEVWPTQGDLMIAKPVGVEEGLGALGFCYVPYKFVYDIYFPVLIQIMDANGEEIFQFPIGVVIEKNKPRESLIGEEIEQGLDLCENANNDLIVSTSNNELEPVEADIEFECLTSTCDLGKTEIIGDEARLSGKVPGCINGVVIANADGYAEKRQTISSNEESFADMYLDREYDLDIEVYVDGQLSTNPGLISFESENFFNNIIYPQRNNITLGEAQYDITAYVMRQGSITIPEKTVTECASVKEGIAGFFGFETERCFDVTIPSQTLDQVLYAGGSTKFFAVESQLRESSKIRIDMNSFPVPNTLEQLQRNYELFDSGKIIVDMQ